MLTLENTPCICYCFWVTVVCCAAHEQAAQHLCCCDSSSSAGLQKLLSALTYGLVLNITHVFADDKRSFHFSFVFIVVELHKRRVSRCVVLYKLSACVFGYRQRFHAFIRAPPVLPASCKPPFIYFRGSSKWQWHLITPATGRKWEKVQLIYGATHFVIKYAAFVPAWDRQGGTFYVEHFIDSFIYLCTPSKHIFQVATAISQSKGKGADPPQAAVHRRLQTGKIQDKSRHRDLRGWKET